MRRRMQMEPWRSEEVFVSVATAGV